MSGSDTGFNWRVTVKITLLWAPVVFTIVLRLMWHNVQAGGGGSARTAL